MKILILMVNNDYMYNHDDLLLGELMMNDKSLKNFDEIS